MIWKQNPPKKVNNRSLGNFVGVLHVGISLIKLKIMTILGLSWGGSSNSKKCILQLISKNGLFFAHTSVRNQVFVFFIHFPKVPNLVEKIVLFLIKPGMDHFSTGTGRCQLVLKLGL